MSLADAARSRVGRSPWGIVAWEILADTKAGLRNQLGRHTTESGATHCEMTLAGSLGYVDQVFTDYLEYGGLGRDLQGMRVLEVGPGDSPAVALRFLAAGAERVVCVDRFRIQRDPRQQQEILRAVVAELPEAERARLDGVIDVDGALDERTDRLEFLEGLAIEQAVRRLTPASFDVIVSRAVLEHVDAPVRALEVMDELLAPGGLQLHKVDLRDHGVFTGRGQQPLTFLTIPDFVFDLTRRRRGGVNRARRNEYVTTLERLGYDVRIWATHLVGQDAELLPHLEDLGAVDINGAQRLVEGIRPRLARRFRNLPSNDLVIEGIFVAARKRG